MSEKNIKIVQTFTGEAFIGRCLGIEDGMIDMQNMYRIIMGEEAGQHKMGFVPAPFHPFSDQRDMKFSQQTCYLITPTEELETKYLEASSGLSLPKSSKLILG